MNSAQLKLIRETLGLSQTALAALLQMGGDGGRTVRRWELGERPIPGPVALLMAFLAANPRTLTAFRSISTRIDRGPIVAEPSAWPR